MLEQWLSTEEGRDYVSKNKLFHLLTPRTRRESAIATASKHTASGANLLSGLSQQSELRIERHPSPVEECPERRVKLNRPLGLTDVVKRQYLISIKKYQNIIKSSSSPKKEVPQTQLVVNKVEAASTEAESTPLSGIEFSPSSLPSSPRASHWNATPRVQGPVFTNLLSTWRQPRSTSRPREPIPTLRQLENQKRLAIDAE